ncbi:MAG: conjugative transposon protein TraM [Cytophagales bacterium]|nr:conjugative transposon protein TraM [Cytophagales bacterium]
MISGFKQKGRSVIDPNEEKVNRKLKELYSEINKPAQGVSAQNETAQSIPVSSDPQFASDVSRLEVLMETMQSDAQPDPEMEQIEGVLEKILDIQHPERVKERLSVQDKISKSNALSVEPVDEESNISMMNSLPPLQPALEQDSAGFDRVFQTEAISSNGFFGLDDESVTDKGQSNSIQAVIHDTQELVAGSTVKMRLLNEIQVNGHRIPKDQLVYGVCSINSERLTIEIASVRISNFLLPVALKVFDLDGLEGIYIPGAIARDAAKQASNDALQNIQLMSLNPSIGAQAAAAGVEAAKGLFTKKAKLIKVTVKAGYQILLKDTSPSNQMNF